MSQISTSGGGGGGGTVTSVSGGNNITITGTATDPIVNVSGTTDHAVQVGNATGSLTSLALGTSGFVLTSNGAGMDPSFQAAAGGGITDIDGDTGTATGSTITFTGSTNGGFFTAAGSTVTLSFEHIDLPLTDNTTEGRINIATVPYFHAYTGGAAPTNVFIANAGNLTNSGADNNIGIGNGAIASLSSGINNVAIGLNAGFGFAGDNNNVVIGVNAGSSSAGDFSSLVAIGNAAGSGGAFYTNAIAIGTNTMAGAGASATGTIAIGNGAMQTPVGNIDQSIGIGTSALVNGGSSCIAIGQNAGSANSGFESNNILIANVGVSGQSGQIQIGTSGTQTKCFIAGIVGVTTDVNDAIPVLIDSAGQLGTVSSSARYKENIRPMGDLSEKIYDLDPVTFSYKVSPHATHPGLIAEQVQEALPELVVRDDQGLPETVKYHELPVLLLNEIKKLRARIELLEKGS